MKSLLLSALVASALVLVAGGNACDTYFTNPNMTCIKAYECGPGGSSITIYEDCPPGTELLTAIDTNPSCNCDRLTDCGKSVRLKTQLDAEKDNTFTINCYLFSESYITEFPVENVNEFFPQVQDRGPIFDIRVPEEGGQEVIATFSYQDEDYKETQSLTCELRSGDIDNLFEVISDYENEMMSFSLGTKNSLDFEKMMYYRLEYDIKSTDSRGDILVANQTILVFVDDIGDNPPYWIKTQPSVSLEECDAGVSVVQVEASDRDVEINNAIRYSITDGNDEGFFTIDDTGEVKTAKKIDREALATTTFALTVTATEHNADGSVADEPNSSTQATNVYIVDVNDNVPTFNEPEYYAEIDELNENEDVFLNIDLFVTDMDEGQHGTFTLTSDKPEDLVVSPSQGMGNETLSLKAKWRDGTLFDYEKTQDNLTFTLTATEVSDPSHVGTATLVVMINDVNDNRPVFSEPVYNVNVNETEPEGFHVTTVKATDSDISPDFGTDSIRYSSTCEDKLHVDSMTGQVTLAANVLDYEAKVTLQCNIEAHDLYGAEAGGKGGYTTVNIMVSDVIDEQPSIIQPDVTTIQENTPEGTPVGQPVRATDADEGADINISIDWDDTKAYLQNNVVNPSIVKDWFKILETDVNTDDYSAVVYVGPNNPDREKADKVELSIVATDRKTESGTDHTSTIFTININNTNDEKPFFVDDYSTQQVKEEVPGGTLIAKLLVNDYDLDDIIDMTISNDSLVRVVMEENFKTWNLEVSPGARIDREVQEEIIVIVTITDSNGASDEMEIKISIIDINDNTPVISNCTADVEVAEDELTGHHVGNIMATDEDIGAHGEVKYYLFNDQLGMPFEVNEETGEVTVLLGDLQLLDRETKASWELSVYARDGCEEGELDCQRKNSDPCNIVVTVTDVNDEAPNRFQWDPPADSFVVYEDMLKGELVGGEEPYKIRAQDGDQPGTVNTMITYYIEWVHKVGFQEDLGFFRAVNVNDTWSNTSYCQLMATQNLTWQRGTYEILLVAEDSGEPKMNGSTILNIEIQDSNDHTPEFWFEGCLKDKLQIKMEENYYQPGDRVLCATDQNALELEILVRDEDIGENRDFTCDIDYEKSTAVPVNGVDQLQDFELKRESDGCVLYVNSIIDRESGRRYNLSLHVKDKGTPPRESWEYLEVIVTNAFEAPPYFCLEGMCKETVYMKENDPDVTSMFLEAIDPDNIDSDPDDDGTYEDVFYNIVGGTTSFFELGGTNRMNNSIRLRNLPQGLDREDVPEYQLYIDVTNDPSVQPPISEQIPRNYTLYLTIIVQDENDNPPEFKKAITIASFTQNDEKGKKIAVIEANDVDLNETITYSLGKFAWNDTDGTVSTDEPFKIENGADLILNFKPTGLNSGYCTFRIYAHDKDNKTNFTTAKVYVITNAFQLPVSFNNGIREVSNKTEDIEDIFTSVYQYSCVVDSTTAETSDSGEAVEGQTIVYMHFIDETQNEPVPKNVIIQQTTNVGVITDLRKKLNEIGLYLNSVGDKEVVSEGNDLLLLQVLLGVVSLVLGSLVVLLLTAYCIRTRSLERQVKVMSTNTFGSKESDLNRAGMEMEVVPGSNMFKGEGANPMYNMSEDELRNDETSSIGSGDSVLVGVEDNPEFKNYINRRADAPAPSECASGARSIDQVSAPAAFTETTRSNPLLDMGEVEDRDLSEALRDFEVTIRRSSCESEGSFGHDNPNFTFGK